MVARPSSTFLLTLLLCALALAVTLPAFAASRPGPKPIRIVSLTLGTDEILLALVEPSRVLAVTYLAAEPVVSNVVREARAVPHRIGTDPERIISLRPDLVLAASYTTRELVRLLRDAGVRVVQVQLFDSVDRIGENVALVAAAVGEEARGRAIIAAMEARLQRLAAAVARRSWTPRVLFYSSEGTTVGRGTAIGDIITRAGGVNAGALAGLTGHAPLSLEGLVAVNPDVMLLGDYHFPRPTIHSDFLNHPAVRGLEARRASRIYTVSVKYLSTVSHHIARGVEEVVRRLHPGLLPPKGDGDG
ncbi:MAG: ABC transporter substrate-binding protein [Deltaproteobacteria bacterium]|nr:ABC transporter substrate-binding protein [Deltaproteobacteria bacterium]